MPRWGRSNLGRAVWCSHPAPGDTGLTCPAAPLPPPLPPDHLADPWAVNFCTNGVSLAWN